MGKRWINKHNRLKKYKQNERRDYSYDIKTKGNIFDTFKMNSYHRRL